mmetsp:Transcript_71776/g.156244  ORF Transcript_71776/g.156244 Transcript_71776/m.156244 type:complete len:128 (-) Transcript_71776:123-506(-)
MTLNRPFILSLGMAEHREESLKDYQLGLRLVTSLLRGAEVRVLACCDLVVSRPRSLPSDPISNALYRSAAVVVFAQISPSRGTESCHAPPFAPGRLRKAPRKSQEAHHSKPTTTTTTLLRPINYQGC